jgi:hypothetical protein
MLTSESTLMRHYVRLHSAEQYIQAQAQLESVLKKRPRPEEVTEIEASEEKEVTEIEASEEKERDS